MIRNKNLDRRRVIKRIPWDRFQFIYDHTHTYTGSPTNSTDARASMDAGAAPALELSTFGWGRLNMSTDGDMACALDFDFLDKVDFDHEIGARVIFCTIGTTDASDDILWKVTYCTTAFAADVSAPATALDTVITQSANVANNTLSLRRTARGIISANKFAPSLKDNIIVWRVENDASNFSSPEVGFLALELDYVPDFGLVTADFGVDYFKDKAESLT